MGIQVFDEELKHVGKIVDIFGPVDHPYVSVKSNIDGCECYVGRPLYVMD